MARPRGNPAWVKNMAPANPKGRPKIPDLVELKKIRRIKRAEAQDAIQTWISKPIDELKIACKNPDTKALDAMIISTILHAIQYGDHKRIDWIFTQLLGRIPINIEDNRINGPNIQRKVLLELPKSERIKEKKTNEN